MEVLTYCEILQIRKNQEVTVTTQEACKKIFSYLAIEHSISPDLRDATQQFIAGIPKDCTFTVPKARAALGHIEGVQDFEGCYELEACLEEIANKLRQAGGTYCTTCDCTLSESEHVLVIYRTFVNMYIAEELMIALATVMNILTKEKVMQFLEAQYHARPSDN